MGTNGLVFLVALQTPGRILVLKCLIHVVQFVTVVYVARLGFMVSLQILLFILI